MSMYTNTTEHTRTHTPCLPDRTEADRRSGRNTHVHTLPAYQTAQRQIAGQGETHTYTNSLPTRPHRDRSEKHTRTHTPCLPDRTETDRRSGRNTHVHTLPAYQTAQRQIASQGNTHNTHTSLIMYTYL